MGITSGFLKHKNSLSRDISEIQPNYLCYKNRVNKN